MNKLINIIFILFLVINYCFCIKVKRDDINNSLINLIVDSNKFNNYPIGGKCGSNITLSCNNMIDALNYAQTLSGGVSQIGFLLMDGIYDFTNNTIQVFGIGVGIASYNIGSVNVIFKGGNKNNVPLVTINESINNVSKTGITQTTLSFSDVSFQDFSSSIIDVIVNLTNVQIEIENCNFNNYSSNVSNVSMINVSSDAKESSSISVTIRNSGFTGSRNSFNDVPTIYLTSTTLNIYNSSISNIFGPSFISSLNSEISVFGCNVGFTSTQYGVFKVQDTTLELSGSTFTNCTSSISGGVLTSTTTSVSNNADFNFRLQDCQISNCSSLNGGSIYASNIGPYQPMTSNIMGCTFSGGYASNSGGVIYSINTPLNIVDTQFTSNLLDTVVVWFL
ncbi:hypothetical protein ACTA71_003099 [Dictyostelium dimigraforme]